MLIRTAVLLGLLAAPALAQGDVWLVDDSGCPGYDFAALQDAIQVADSGDTILVSAGLGSPQLAVEIVGKSLTVSAEPDVVVGTASDLPVVVRDLAADQRVVLRGLRIQSGLDIVDCAGTVLLEDCILSTEQFHGAQPAVDVRDSSGTVSLVRCELTGADDTGFLWATAGLEVRDATAFLVDSQVTGGAGRESSGATTPGAPGSLVDAGGFLLLSGSSSLGGEGGADIFGPSCTPAAGGPGVRLDDVQLACWTFGSSLQGGPGTSNGACAPGPEGAPVDGVGAFHLQDLGGPARGFTAAASGYEGETVLLGFEPEPSDQVFLLLSLDLAPVQVPGWHGALLPELGGSALFALGALGGPADVPVNLPTGLLGAGQALGVGLQALYLDGVERIAGPGSWLTILDDGLQGSVDCGTFWVDDDAPGDPAPGDPSLGDPLEDGSPAHPFDSIQEAVDAAFPGATVRVRDGSYSEASGLPIHLGGKLLTLESESGPDACTILAGDRGVQLGNDPEGAELRGFTIRGAAVTGIEVLFFSQATIRDCVIRDNAGTGMTVGTFSQVLVRDCLFRDNAGGGLIVLDLGLPLVERCTFLDNTSSLVGGGVFIEAGGALDLRDSILNGNTALFGSGVFVEGEARLSGCTVAHNPAGPGSELFVTDGGFAQVDNSIVWGGTAPIHVQGAGTLELDWCDVKGGLAALSSSGAPNITWGANTVDVLPNFKDVPGDDLHLKAGSPCRDAGDPAFVAEPGRSDIDGEARVQGGVIDLGADELP